MLIGLIDIDGHNRKTRWGSAFPNLALMKIAAWHRAQGDVVEWADPSRHYDVLYHSKIFKSSPDVPDIYHADRVESPTRSARRDACQSKKLPKGEDVRMYCKLN